MQQGRVTRILQSTVFRVLVGLALLAALFSIVDLRTVGRTLAGMPPAAVAGQLALFYLAQALASQRWRYFLALNDVTIRFGTAHRLNFLGLFTSCFLPGSVGGDALKIAVLTRQHGATARIIAASLLDRLVNTGVVTVVACAMMPRIFSLLPVGPQALHTHTLQLTAIAALAALLGLGLLIRLVPLMVRRGFIPASVAARLEQAGRALAVWRRRPGVFAGAAVLSVLMLLGSTIGGWLLLLGMGASIAYVDVLTVYLTLHFITILPISIGGIGVTEVSMVVLLGMLGVDRETATAFAILSRGLYMLAVAPGSFAYVRQSHGHETTGTTR